MKYVRRVGLFAAIIACSSVGHAQRTRPYAVLERASKLEFTAPTDSNSPAFWRLQQGSKRLRVLNSAGTPVLSTGVDIEELQSVGPVTFDNTISGGRWIEAVVTDHRGVVYGYYHNEPQGVCPGSDKTAPRIGAARSYDGGRSWIDLGIILEAPPDSTLCQTNNGFFVGGVGDCSVMLDADGKYLYVFFSAYPRQLEEQGVAVARLRWSDRDTPVGRVALWNDGVWRYPEDDDDGRLVYPAARPIFTATRSWHARGDVEAFWGPSVHWNTFLERYVMLLNHASNGDFAQEGIYLSAAELLDDPRGWTPPQRILSGGKWYPQVIGLEPGAGTDRLAGERARFFMSGVSDHVIEFQRPGDVAIPR
jgi:hypothetical protein